MLWKGKPTEDPQEPLQDDSALYNNVPDEPTRSHDPYRALRFRDFRLLFAGTFVASIGEQMLNVAIGWELYERTGSALALGFVGLVQVVPVILLSLPAGYLADRFNRRRIVVVTLLGLVLASLGLTVLSYTHGALMLIYGCLLLAGIAVAFNGPASTTLLPQTVPEDVYSSAVFRSGHLGRWWRHRHGAGRATGRIVQRGDAPPGSVASRANAV